MELILYKTNDAANVIGKVLTEPKTIEIFPFNDFDIINPVLFIDDVDGLNIRQYNYFEIPELNRKYIIEDLIAVNRAIVRVNSSCDVLETYRALIENSQGGYRRTNKVGEYFDYSYGVSSKADIENYYGNVEISGDNSSVVLTTIGGVEQ